MARILVDNQFKSGVNFMLFSFTVRALLQYIISSQNLCIILFYIHV